MTDKNTKKEIEIKYELLNRDELVDFLIENATNHIHSHIIDTYYDNPKNSFLSDMECISDWLRIREENGKYIMNFKHWLPEDAKIKTYCDETEFELKDKNEMNKFLPKLRLEPGFEPFVVVDKTRDDFLYGDCEISVDSIKNLGDYVEVEYKGESKNIENTLKYLEGVLSKTNAELGAKRKDGNHLFALLKKEV